MACVIAVHFYEVSHSAGPIPKPVDLNDKVERIRYLDTYKFVVEIGVGRQSKVRNAVQRKHSRIRVNRRHGTAVAGVHGLQHVISGMVPDLANDDAIRPVT